MDVGIDTDSVLAIGERRNKVGCFPSHSFQQKKFFYGVGHFSVVFPKNHSTEISNSFRLDPVKSHRIDRSFDRFRRQLRQGFRCSGELKKAF